MTRAEMLAAQSRETEARRTLERLLGRLPKGEITASESPAEVGIITVDVPMRVLARRPDIQAGFARLNAAFEARQSAQAALLPEITLSGGLTRTHNQGVSLSDITQWSLIGAASRTLLDYGAQRSLVEARDLQQQAAAEVYQQLVLNALSEVETALTLETSLGHQLTALNAALTAAQMTEADMLARYRDGLATAQEMINARLQSAEIELSRLQTRTALLQARVQLGLALALPWPSEEGHPGD